MSAILFAVLFGTPLAAGLAVLGAASIPILIHLLNRRRYRVVTWAAMRFLLAAQRKNTRRMRLEQFLLLLVRTALIVLLVLAMASVLPWAESIWRRVFPAQAVQAAAGTRRTHKILVLDGSFSMGLHVGNSTAFDQARARALEILRESAGGDGFSVVLQAAPPRRIVPEPSLDARKVGEEIQALTLPHGNADFVATLTTVEDLVRHSPNRFEEREVYFLTDLQRATWTARSFAEAGGLLQKIQGRARTIFVHVGGDAVANSAVTNLTLGVPFITTGGATPIQTTLHHHGTDLRKQTRVELLVGRAKEATTDPAFEPRVVEQKLIDLAPGQQTVSFDYRFSTPGEYVVQVRLEHDALELDDSRTVVVTVKDTVPVMLVNGKPAADVYDQATEWLQDALNPYRGGPIPRNVPARPRILSEAQFADAGLGDLTAYDCVFLCDVARLGMAEIHRLEAHLRRGGGVVFTLGSHVDLEAYNRLLYRNGEGLLPAQLKGRQTEPKHHAFSFLIDQEEKAFAEPPLQAFSRAADRVSLYGARFRQYLRAELEPKGRARKVLGFKPEMTTVERGASGVTEEAKALPVGEPALIEWTRYRGKVLLFTSTVNMDWTSWPISPSFPALMQELLRFAVAGRLREHALAVGEPLEEFLQTSGVGLEVTLLLPDGRTESARTVLRDDAPLFTWADTDRSGIYRAMIGQHPREHLFAVNVPTTTEAQQACESDLARTNRAELQSAYPGWECQVVTNLRDASHQGGLTDDPTLETPLSGLGTVVARVLLLTMLALFFVEVFLAWKFGHYRNVPGVVSDPAATGRVLPLSIGVIAGVLAVVLFGTLAHAAWTGDFLGFLPDSFRAGIETRLGTPPPAPGEGSRWHLDFRACFWNGDADPWLVGTLFAAATVFVVLLYLREGPTISREYKLLLAGLRLFFLLLTLLILLPQVRLWIERQGWPDLVLLIDDSRSMSTVDRYQDADIREAARKLAEDANLPYPQRLQLAQALLTQTSADWLGTLLTERKFKLHIYHGSARAGRLVDLTEASSQEAAVQAILGLQATGESSQLGGMVRQVLNDFRGSSLAAVVVLTDGVTTEGEDLAKVSRHASQMGVPLYYIGIGDAHETRDLRLHDLQVEDSVHVNDRLIFEGRLTGQGYRDLTVPVRLREKGSDRILAQQRVTVDPQGKPVKFRLTHQPTDPGEKTYIIDVPEQEDEIKPAHNNRIERTVFVREARILKVLYIEGDARYEYRYVKHLLERESEKDKRNKTIDLKVLLLDADEEYPRIDRSAIPAFPLKVQLNEYDVIILGDADPKHPKLGERNLKNLADFVRERGGGLLLVAGEQHNPRAYRDTPLRDVLPIDLVNPAPAESDHVTTFRPELTPIGRFHPLFRFTPDEADNQAIWKNLPPLYWWLEGYKARPGAEVLAIHPQRFESDPRRPGGRGTQPLPLIVQQFVGAGRCLFFGIDETWRWRYREKEVLFNQFWIQTIRYLARSRLGRIDLGLDRQTPYRRGEPIKVTVRFPDDAPPPGPEAEVKVTVERSSARTLGQGETEVQTLRLAKLDGSRATYEAILTQTPEGDYRFSLSTPAVPPPQPRTEGRVLPPPGELEQLRMNQTDMQRSAEETQGHYYTLATADRLLHELPAGTRIALHAPLPPWLLWNHGTMFALALGLLGSEWVLRKRKHLL